MLRSSVPRRPSNGTSDCWAGRRRRPGAVEEALLVCGDPGRARVADGRAGAAAHDGGVVCVAVRDGQVAPGAGGEGEPADQSARGEQDRQGWQRVDQPPEADGQGVPENAEREEAGGRPPPLACRQVGALDGGCPDGSDPVRGRCQPPAAQVRRLPEGSRRIGGGLPGWRVRRRLQRLGTGDRRLVAAELIDDGLAGLPAGRIVSGGRPRLGAALVVRIEGLQAQGSEVGVGAEQQQVGDPSIQLVQHEGRGVERTACGAPDSRWRRCRCTRRRGRTPGHQARGVPSGAQQPWRTADARQWRRRGRSRCRRLPRDGGARSNCRAVRARGRASPLSPLAAGIQPRSLTGVLGFRPAARPILVGSGRAAVRKRHYGDGWPILAVLTAP